MVLIICFLNIFFKVNTVVTKIMDQYNEYFLDHKTKSYNFAVNDSLEEF